MEWNRIDYAARAVDCCGCILLENICKHSEENVKPTDSSVSTFSIILIITWSVGIMTTPFAHAQANQTSSFDVQNIPSKKVHVGDIDIAYKIFGKGDPFLLISGSGLVMDAWDPTMLRELSSDHKVIIFDNRGVGTTTAAYQT